MTFHQEASEELAALGSAFKARREAEADRFRLATDSEYWFAVCFTSRDEKEQFLKAAGLSDHGDKYLDGRIVADTLGINMDGD